MSLPAADSRPDRLFRHDAYIAINTIQATFAGWHDRLIAATMLVAALAVVRSGLADQPWTIAALAALAAGIVVGMGAGRLAAARLAFHGFDGLLAADALKPSTRRRYMVAWHGIGMAMLVTMMLVARPSLLIVALPAYLAGAVLAHITAGLTMSGAVTGRMRPVWTIRNWLHRPSAGIIAAVILLLSLLPARTLGTNVVMAVISVETVLLSLTLTIVDDGIVRFMTIAGHGSWRIILRHAKSMLSLVAVTVPVCWFVSGPVAAGLAAAASAAMLLLLILRVLAYRLHGKRFANVLVSVFAGLLILVAYSMPVALPLVTLAVLWHLQRRGAKKVWLLE